MKKLLPDLPGLYLALILPLFVVFKSKGLLVCGDTYWHIRVGQTMLERGELLRNDIFSHTAPGKPWIAHEWFSEVLMGYLFNLAGLPAVTLTFLLVASFAYYLLMLTARQLTSDWSMALAAALAIPLSYTHLLARPHLFTWFFGALTIFLLVRQRRFLWLLPIITALWANLHGGFVFGLFIQGAFWAGSLLDNWPGRSLSNWQQQLSDQRQPAVILLLSVIASCVNPYGYHLLLFPLEVSSPVFVREIGEWMAPDLQQFLYLRLWIVLMIILAALYFRRTPWAWRILFVFLIYQALGHNRHVSIASLYTLPWVAMAIHSIRTELPVKPASGAQLSLSPWTGPVFTLLLFSALFTTNLLSPAAWERFSKEQFSPPAIFSPKLVEHLGKGYDGKRLLNEYSLGGFLLFSLKNSPPVFIDGRADMYGEEIFSDYVKITKLNPGFESLLDKYRIDWIIFPKEHHLVRYLMNTRKWKQAYMDDQILVLTKQLTPPQDFIPTRSKGDLR